MKTVLFWNLGWILNIIYCQNRLDFSIVYLTYSNIFYKYT